MTKIKFCGIRSPETADAINRVLPDYAGFILEPRFWRYITPEAAIEIIRRLDPRVTPVAVFVDSPFDYAERVMKTGYFGMAQLHGHEDAGYINDLRKSSGRADTKAFSVKSPEDIEAARECPADYVLLDSGTGTGEQFDWGLIKSVGRDYFLAGGLCPENAAEAVKALRPYCVDVSSGIETDRVKDPKKMLRFAEAVRGQKI